MGLGDYNTTLVNSRLGWTRLWQVPKILDDSLNLLVHPSIHDLAVLSSSVFMYIIPLTSSSEELPRKEVAHNLSTAGLNSD